MARREAKKLNMLDRIFPFELRKKNQIQTGVTRTNERTLKEREKENPH